VQLERAVGTAARFQRSAKRPLMEIEACDRLLCAHYSSNVTLDRGWQIDHA